MGISKRYACDYRLRAATALALLLAMAGPGWAAPSRPSADSKNSEPALTASAPDQGVLFHPEGVGSDGTVTVEGTHIDYHAVAGTIIVHPKDWDDAAWREHPGPPDDDKDKSDKTKSSVDLGDRNKTIAEASMFYTAYFKKGVPAADRPITFLFNGGPGSATVWLHIGAFGPRRVITRDDSHTPSAPYAIANNSYSLLDASDLVFIDAPGTGFSRVAGKDKEKAFYGVDTDVYAFSQFIQGFLSKYGRWNSPKYLFGESYGTPRNANLINVLERGDSIDFNGVIQLSQILNYDLSVDGPLRNPGTDQAFITALPTYAATAWYHHLLPGTPPAALEPFLAEVEHFAVTDYAQALQRGAELSDAEKQTIAQKMHDYIGLPAAYLVKADLRIDGGMFEKALQDTTGQTTGRFDTRFSGTDMDPLSKKAGYDPQSAAISSAYISGFNDYVRKDLHYGLTKTYKPSIPVGNVWKFEHQPPGSDRPARSVMNVMPDLAAAMKYNPDLKVMLNGGYFDLATPFYEGWYEMHHLPIPNKLQGNIEYHYYQSGHMVYAHEASLKLLHDNVADFIRRTDNLNHAK